MKTRILLLLIPLLAGLFHNSEAQVLNNQEAQAKKDTVMAHLKKAESLVQQGNAREASKIYVSIMQSEPDNKEAVQGWLMVNIRRTPTGEEEAIIMLDSLNKLYPKNTGIIFFRAFIEGEYGHNEEALKDLDTLIKILPDDPLNYIGRGQVLYEMKKYEEAFQSFDKATSLDSTRPDLWGMKASALAKTGKFDDAIIAINKGLELDPNSPYTFYNRACIYCLKGDKVNAIDDLKRAISMDASFREYALKDADFKSLYDDEDFRKLTFSSDK